MMTRAEKNKQYKILNSILKEAGLFDPANMTYSQRDYYKGNYSSDDIAQQLECKEIRNTLIACLSKSRIFIMRDVKHDIIFTIELCDPDAIEKLRNFVATEYVRMAYLDLSRFLLKSLTLDQLMEFYNTYYNEDFGSNHKGGTWYDERVRLLGEFITGNKTAFLLEIIPHTIA